MHFRHIFPWISLNTPQFSLATKTRNILLLLFKIYLFGRVRESRSRGKRGRR